MEYTFYRIYSKNPAITECYIGSTEDLYQRKILHKSDCNNINSTRYNIKVYQYIRSNGGFDEFEFEIVDTFTSSETDRFIHENKLMDLYGSTLNTKRAFRTEEERKEYDKEYKKEYSKEYYETHKEEIKEYSIKYSKEYRETHKEQLNKKIICEVCGGKYTVRNKGQHLKTNKHINQVI